MYPMPLIWLVISIILFGIEALTVGLTTIWFAIGALVAIAAAWLNAPILLQIFLFVMVSLFLLVLTRPLAVRMLNKKVSPSGASSLIGKTAIVITTVDNLKGNGQVRIGDLEWSARSDRDDLKIEKDAVVEILRIEGVKLIVREINK